MGQVTIYLQDEIEAKMCRAAEDEHLSKSKWITNLIKDKVAGEWSASFVKLAGAWEDFPTAEEIRDSQYVDIAREDEEGNTDRCI